MTYKEKMHEISVAYNCLEKVLENTDEDLWAYKHLEDAIIALDFYFEEGEI